jgi:putative heme transporter
VLLAFFTAQLLGTLPLTPGGLGFVEAGLTGTLALAGVGAGAAVVATLAYRLVSFWLPIPAGAVAAIIHRRKLGEGSQDELEEARTDARRPAQVAESRRQAR